MGKRQNISPFDDQDTSDAEGKKIEKNYRGSGVENRKIRKIKKNIQDIFHEHHWEKVGFDRKT